MIRTALILAVIASPAHAQSFDEAVRQNVALAVSICAQHVGEPTRARTALEAAGFAYGGFDGSLDDATHRYTAPAGTAEVLVYQGQMAPDCRIETQHLGPTDAGRIAGGVLQGVMPGRFTPTATYCPGYTEPGRQLPQTISVTDLGNAGSCNEGEGARINLFFAV